MQDLTERGGSLLRYKGANGRLRVSAWHLDPALSTEAVPAHSFDRVEKLQPGEIAEIEVDLFPIGIVFYPGQQLRLVVSAKNDLGPSCQVTPGYVPKNKSQHILHTGGAYASYLQLPVTPAYFTLLENGVVTGPPLHGVLKAAQASQPL